MRNLLNVIVAFILTFAWFWGMVLAKGWLKLLVIVFFPYGYYLVVEKIVAVWGLN